MKLSATASGIAAILLFVAGYLVGGRADPDAQARVDTLEIRRDSLDQVAARRDTVHVTRLVAARGRTDTLLQRDTLIHRDTVTIVLAAERAACDTALAAKDSTITENVTLRNDAIQEAAQLARRGPSRLAVSAVLVFPEARPVLTGTVRLTRILGLDVNVGVGWRP